MTREGVFGHANTYDSAAHDQGRWVTYLGVVSRDAAGNDNVRREGEDVAERGNEPRLLPTDSSAG
jgi:hypothetical protein